MEREEREAILQTCDTLIINKLRATCVNSPLLVHSLSSFFHARLLRKMVTLEMRTDTCPHTVRRGSM